MELKDLDQLIKKFEKMNNDRIEYGYDSICLRIEALVSELAILKARVSDTHKGDIDYWERWYGNRAVRIYQILDDLLDNKGHSHQGD